MDFEKTEKLVGGVAAILASVGAWLRWFLPFWKGQKQQRSMVKGLQTLHEVYSAMERIQGHGATRIIIFGGHNSGGIPRVDSPFYCTALHWTVSPAYVDRVGDYTELAVDSSYIRMLLQLERTGSYRFDMAKEEGTMLKRYYEAEGIVDAVLFYLTSIEHTFLYMSVCSHTHKFTENEITVIQLITKGIAQDIKHA